MNSSIKISGLLALIVLCTIIIASCSEDDTIDPGGNSGDVQGEFTLSMTDAPSDDADIEAVFVTVAAVELDGTMYPLDQPETVEISALTDGQSEVIFDSDIDARTYSNIALVLNYEADVAGNYPGCYVQTTDGAKHDLNATSSMSGKLIVKNSQMTLDEGGTLTATVDLDLRKAIKYSGEADDRYDFRSDMTVATRFVADQHYMINGRLEDDLGLTGDKVIVYAYAKGTFDKETESGDMNDMFVNAVTSTEVDADGYFALHFLEEGEYEIKAVSYEQEDNQYEAKAYLMVSSSIFADIGVLNLESNMSLDLLVIGTTTLQ